MECLESGDLCELCRLCCNYYFMGWIVCVDVCTCVHSAKTVYLCVWPPLHPPLWTFYYLYVFFHSECNNQFVEIKYNSAATTISCVFLNQLDSSEKSCSIQYGICDQEQTEMVASNTTSGNVMLNLALTGSGRVYCYNITARNRTYTVIVDGKIGRSYMYLSKTVLHS